MTRPPGAPGPEQAPPEGEAPPQPAPQGGPPDPAEGTASWGGTDAAPSEASAPGVPPDLVDHPRYQVLECLGAGGMGTVYKARHRLMDRLVALKVINPALVERPAVVERFYREIQAAARLSHPNIVTAYDADRAGHTCFLAMELVEGVNLDSLLGQRKRLPPSAACEYVRQAALGLQHAHERGMVHRDIKPHNLMLAPGEQVKILDFGLARFCST